MSIGSKLTQFVFRVKYTITDNELKAICIFLFDIALNDPESARILVSKPNKINKNLVRFVDIKKLHDFMNKYPHLTSNLYECMQSEGTEDTEEKEGQVVSKPAHSDTTFVRFILKNYEQTYPDEEEAICRILYDEVLKDRESAMLVSRYSFIFILLEVLNISAMQGLTAIQDKHPEIFKSGSSTSDILTTLCVTKGSKGMSGLVAAYNPEVRKVGGQLQIECNGKFYPIITRGSRDFTFQDLYLAGAAESQETLKLSPDSSSLLGLYSDLKKEINPNDSTEKILEKVCNFTLSILKARIEDEEVQKLRDEHKYSVPLSVPLDAFISIHKGECRHHAVLNAYLLFRLVQDQLLKGEVIYHRQKFDKAAAHAWNLFRDANTGQLYSLDSFQKHVIPLEEVSEDLLNVQNYLPPLNFFYGQRKVKIDEKIFERFGKAKIDPKLALCRYTILTARPVEEQPVEKQPVKKQPVKEQKSGKEEKQFASLLPPPSSERAKFLDDLLGPAKSSHEKWKIVQSQNLESLELLKEAYKNYFELSTAIKREMPKEFELYRGFVDQTISFKIVDSVLDCIPGATPIYPK